MILYRALHLFLHALWLLPIKKNRVFFDSFAGKQISCNPLYICRELKARFSETLEYVWVCSNTPPEEMRKCNARFVKPKSLRHILSLVTSKALVSNSGFSTFVPYRKGQLLVNTWHGGGAYKRSGWAAKFITDAQKKALVQKGQMLSKNAAKRLYVSSCKRFSEDFLKANGMADDDNSILKTGMPRNDIFFDKDECKNVRLHTRKKLNVSDGQFFVLYAPTYRGNSDFENVTSSAYAPNMQALKKAIAEKFSLEAIVAVRAHQFLSETNASDFDLDVSQYPDMQELLCAADMLITDYSSSIWDFSFTYKPCILFAPDIEEYQRERGFYTDPYSWGFPIAKSDDELAKAIMEFDEAKFRAAMQKHHSDLGSYESGAAARQVADIIAEHLNKA